MLLSLISIVNNKQRQLQQQIRRTYVEPGSTFSVDKFTPWDRGTQDGFLPNALKRCFRLSGVLLKLCRLILGCGINFLSVRSF